MKGLERKIRRCTLKAALAVGASLLWVGSSSALPSFGSGLVGGLNLLSDDSGELVIDSDSNGLISVGDYLIGGFQLNSLGPSGAIPGTTVNEGTGIFALEVTGVLGVPDAVCSGAFLLSGCAVFDFSAPGIGFNSALNLTGLDWNPTIVGIDPAAFTGPNGALGADTLLVLFEDPTPDGDILGAASIQDAIDTLVDGSLDLVLGCAGGCVGGGGNFWTGTGPVDPLDGFLNPVGAAIGSFGVNLTITDLGGSLTNLDPTVPVTGSGTIRAPGVGPFPIGNDASFNVVKIPEPASLGLVGLGLLAVGAFARRRKH